MVPANRIDQPYQQVFIVNPLKETAGYVARTPGGVRGGGRKAPLYSISLTNGGLGSKGIIQADPWIQKVALFVCRVEAGVSLDVLEDAFDIDVQRRMGGNRHADPAFMSHLWCGVCMGLVQRISGTGGSGQSITGTRAASIHYDRHR